MCDVAHVHLRDESRIVYLYTLNLVHLNEFLPMRSYRGQVWQHTKKPLDRAKSSVCFVNCQPKAAAGGLGARTNVPELTKVLQRGDADMPAFNQRAH
jgi:hypothetical protein